jgi:Skp family chaperone for outer membrane proteins
MKKTLIYVTLILGVIVASCQGRQAETLVVEAISVEGITIAMINTDSIFAFYDMAADMRRELEETERRLTNDLQQQARRFETDVQNLQNDVQNYTRIGHTLTLSDQNQREAQFRNREEQLQQRAEELQRLEQRYMQQLMELQAQRSREVENAIFAFVERFNQTQGFSIIMSNARGSGVLYSLPSMDITAPILEALNAEYARTRTRR